VFHFYSGVGQKNSGVGRAHLPPPLCYALDYCNRCNVSLSAISEVKASVDELKATFESRLEQLENFIKQSTSAPNERESVINESVERSWKARNVIIYNVDSCEEKRDVDIVNDPRGLSCLPSSRSRVSDSYWNKNYK
jgi:hypothetical protein